MHDDDDDVPKWETEKIDHSTHVRYECSHSITLFIEASIKPRAALNLKLISPLNWYTNQLKCILGWRKTISRAIKNTFSRGQKTCAVKTLYFFWWQMFGCANFLAVHTSDILTVPFLSYLLKKNCSIQISLHMQSNIWIEFFLNTEKCEQTANLLLCVWM